jgi:hypothetical protein
MKNFQLIKIFSLKNEIKHSFKTIKKINDLNANSLFLFHRSYAKQN